MSSYLHSVGPGNLLLSASSSAANSKLTGSTNDRGNRRSRKASRGNQRPPMLLPLEKGRSLAYTFYGDTRPSAKTVIYFNGLWQCRLAGAYFGSTPGRMGVRLVCVDRHGVGQTDALNDLDVGTRILGFTMDVLRLIKALKLKEYYFLAYSGGAAFALTAAHFLTKSKCHGLRGIALMAGLPPSDVVWPSLPLLAKIGLSALKAMPRTSLRMALAGSSGSDVRREPSVRPQANLFTGGYTTPRPFLFDSLMSLASSSAKDAWFSKSVNRSISSRIQDELRPREIKEAVLLDAAEVLSAWPIHPRGMNLRRVPTYIWHGDKDELLSQKVCEAWGEQMREARRGNVVDPTTASPPSMGVHVTHLPDCDHFSIHRHSKRIFTDLINS